YVPSQTWVGDRKGRLSERRRSLSVTPAAPTFPQSAQSPVPPPTAGIAPVQHLRRPQSIARDHPLPVSPASGREWVSLPRWAPSSPLNRLAPTRHCPAKAPHR